MEEVLSVEAAEINASRPLAGAAYGSLHPMAANSFALARSPVEPDSLFFSLQTINFLWQMIRIYIFELEKYLN